VVSCRIGAGGSLKRRRPYLFDTLNHSKSILCRWEDGGSKTDEDIQNGSLRKIGSDGWLHTAAAAAARRTTAARRAAAAPRTLRAAATLAATFAAAPRAAFSTFLPLPRHTRARTTRARLLRRRWCAQPRHRCAPLQHAIYQTVGIVSGTACAHLHHAPCARCATLSYAALCAAPRASFTGFKTRAAPRAPRTLRALRCAHVAAPFAAPLRALQRLHAHLRITPHARRCTAHALPRTRQDVVEAVWWRGRGILSHRTAPA